MKLSAPFKILRKIYLPALFLLFLPAPAGAQDQPVIFPRPDATLSEAIEAIEKQTDFRFVYYSTLLDITRTVTLPAGQTTLNEVLRMIEPQIGFNIWIKLNYILINTSEPYSPAPRQQTRTRDVYRRSDPSIAGIASYPRPVSAVAGEMVQVHSGEGDTLAVRPEPAAYSLIIPIDLYSTVKEHLPLVSVKTNLLYGAAAFTPNIALETGIAGRHSIEIALSHNRWNHKANLGDNKKLMHWIIRPEYRYWFCERFNGHFIGAHAFYSGYNVSGKNIPLLFDKEYRYRGWAVGGGVSYGYHWAFAKKWGLEFNVGVGAAYLEYDRYGCRTCDINSERKTKTYFGPTRAGISLVFLIK